HVPPGVIAFLQRAKAGLAKRGDALRVGGVGIGYHAGRALVEQPAHGMIEEMWSMAASNQSCLADEDVDAAGPTRLVAVGVCDPYAVRGDAQLVMRVIDLERADVGFVHGENEKLHGGVDQVLGETIPLFLRLRLPMGTMR